MARWGGGFGQRLRATGIHLRPLRILSWLSIAWVYLFLFAPLLIIVGASLNGGSNRSGTVIFPPRQLSLDWYLAMPASHLWAIGLSVAVAGLATLIACLIALPAGLGLVRSRAPGRDVAAVIFRLPLQIPVVIVGLSFFYAFYAIDDAVGSGLGWLLRRSGHRSLLRTDAFCDRKRDGGAAALRRTPRGSCAQPRRRALAHLSTRHFAGDRAGCFRWRGLRVPGLFGDVPISLFLAGTGTVTFPVTVFHSLEVDFDATVLPPRRS